MGLFKKRLRDQSYTVDEVYVPRPSTHVNVRNAFNNAKPMLVDTMPIVPDASDQHASFYYREGRDPAHQYSRVTTPLHFNPTFGGLFRDRFIPGAKIPSPAQLVVPRTQNRGMNPIPGRTNQYRPAATSYGTQSQMAPGVTPAINGAMAKWLL